MALSKPKDVGAYVEEMLQCSVCLETVREPQTLQNCLHSYCKECTDQLQHKQNNQPPGVKCPLCGQFSGKDEIRQNFFIKELVEIHSNVDQNQAKDCEQCQGKHGTNQASWKCLDCRMVMCDICKDGHLRIKLLQGHRLVPLTDDTEMVVDQLVFCPIHQDKPIELYCEPCKLPICIKCKVTKHNSHETETIEEVLEKLVPEIKSQTEYIDEYITAVENSRVEIDDKILNIKTTFKKCHSEVDEIAEVRIKEIRDQKKQLQNKLNQQEENEIKKLEDIKNGLAKKQREGQNLKRVVITSLDKARHATLLNELVQGGLQEKMKNITVKPQPAMEYKINMPHFKPNTVVWNTMKEAGLFGTIIMQMSSFFIAMGSVVTSDVNGRFWPVLLKEYLAKPVKQIMQIELSNECTRLMLTGDQIWAPMTNGKVNIYSKTGDLRNTINISNSRSVEKAYNGDIFIACSNGSGLHVITDNDNPVKLCDGHFSDVCSFNYKLYALEYEQKSVIEFCHDNNGENMKWKQVKKIPLNNYKYPDYRDTILLTHQSQNTILRYFYVSSWKKSTIYQYNEQGQLIQQFGRHSAYLCGVDSQSHLLVADSRNNKYKILDPESGQCSDTGISGQTFVYDAKMDNDVNLWLAQYNGTNFIITKHAHK